MTRIDNKATRRVRIRATWIWLSWLAGGLCAAFSASAARAETPVSFELDVQPILSSRGCSTGPCHGKSRGQNGFQLSLLCFDPEFDYSAIVKNARGRRVSLPSPEQSLLLTKAVGEVPHGGGQRFSRESTEYRLLLEWIRQGAPRAVSNEPKLVQITASQTDLQLKPEEGQSLAVTAHYSDGSTRDVTAQTIFDSSEAAVAAVDRQGRIKAGPIPGEAAIVAKYMNLIATCQVAIPQPEAPPEGYYENLPRHNFIDELVWKKLASLRITVSPTVDDAKFLRRVHLDLIGRLPSPEEVRAYLADQAADKRQRLIQSLLDRPEYADHWANKWADLLRPNPYRVGIKAVLNYDNWIREAFRQNLPYDEFARQLIGARGSTWRNGAATLFRDRRTPDELTTLVSQIFLGMRLDCAKCHHHPSEKWSQDDFYGFAAYFARVGHKGTGLSPPISGGEEMVITRKSGEVKHPGSGAVMQPKPLFGEAPPVEAGDDPRDVVVEWITSPQNDYFAEAAVNRVWAELMGRGLTDPVDDLRVTNPPSNGPLLKALANEFRAQKFDLKQLIGTIASSYVYGLSSEATPGNTRDTRNYSRHYRVRLRAEVLADAVADITGVRDTYSAMPAGSRANQIWTTRVESVFLDTFGRPDPNLDPPCERTPDPTVTQMLHLMNAPALQAKISADNSLPAKLAASQKSPGEMIEELYLACYARFPTSEERDELARLIESSGDAKRQFLEDTLWALLNTPEFLFKD